MPTASNSGARPFNDGATTTRATCEVLRARVLEATRRLVVRCGPNVTLSEIVQLAREPAAHPHVPNRDDVIVESLLEQRLGDLVEVVRVAEPPRPSRASHPGAGWTKAVREILSGELGCPELSSRAVARALAVSVRTLQRRLAEEGTSWRAEMDAARKERATQLLRQGATTDLAAARVGYSDSRALRRAVRRWDRKQVDASGPQVDVSGPPQASGRSA